MFLGSDLFLWCYWFCQFQADSEQLIDLQFSSIDRNKRADQLNGSVIVEYEPAVDWGMILSVL